MRMTFWGLLLLCSSAAIAQSVTTRTSSKFLNKVPRNASAKTTYTFQTFAMENQTFGYEIFADGILIFHQQDMPGKVAGTGFSNKEDAAKVAQRVILKLERPVVAPFVTDAELKLLGIQ